MVKVKTNAKTKRGIVISDQQSSKECENRPKESEHQSKEVNLAQDNHRVRLTTVNRIGWMVVFIVFFIGTFFWIEWDRGESTSGIAWFLTAGMLSFICGIGYTITDEWLEIKQSRSGRRE